MKIQVHSLCSLLCALCILLTGCQTQKPQTTAPLVSQQADISATPSFHLADAIILPDGAQSGTFVKTAYGFANYGESVFTKSAYTDMDQNYDPLFEISSHPDLIQTLYEVLSRCGLVESSRKELPTDTVTDLTTESLLFDVIADTVGGTGHLVQIYEDGTVYLSSRNNWDNLLSYQMEDPAYYATMKAKFAALEKESQTLPYQVSLSIDPDTFSPDSKAVRVAISNQMPEEVTLPDGFIVEPWDGKTAGPPLVSKTGELQTPVTIPARKTEGWHSIRLSLDLTALEGGQQPGQYRLRTTAQSGAQHCELTATYTIDAASDVISHPALPKMTPEHQAYYDKYLAVWGGIGDVMENDFSEQDMSTVLDSNLYLVFHNLDYIGERAYDDAEEVAADAVESLMTRRFPITAEQVRGMTNESNRYDKARQVYVMPSGYGGGPGNSAVITASSKKDNLLTLECDWYSGIDGSFSYKTRLTIRLKEDGDFMYLKNERL